jgi:hypothetical protein
LFAKAKNYATTRCEEWYILSAKYGLLHPDDKIEPYDQTLNSMRPQARREWATRVFTAIQARVQKGVTIVFLAGERYRESLVQRLEANGYTARVPLERVSIGKQLSWLTRFAMESERLHHLDEFYRLVQTLDRGLGGRRVMRNCNGSMGWPQMGVYFFFEPKEFRASDVSMDRVVRVGTHGVSSGAKSSLWGRLRTHRGDGHGAGNHRGSIFRLHVGAALMNVAHPAIVCPTWGNGQTATKRIRMTEAELEVSVSRYIGEMSLLWLAIGDAAGPTSDRAYIEQNAIALLAGRTGPIDMARPHWLGRFSARDAIRRSALWNVNHVDEDYDPRFLEVLSTYVDATIGLGNMPSRPVAPKGWATAKRAANGGRQPSLFED